MAISIIAILSSSIFGFKLKFSKFAAVPQTLCWAQSLAISIIAVLSVSIFGSKPTDLTYADKNTPCPSIMPTGKNGLIWCTGTFYF